MLGKGCAILVALFIIRVAMVIADRRRRLRSGKMWQINVAATPCECGDASGTYLVMECDGKLDVGFLPNGRVKEWLTSVGPHGLAKFHSLSPDDGRVGDLTISVIEPAEDDGDQRRAARTIEKPPGYHLRALAEWVYSKKDYSRVFKQGFADMEVEYIEALAEGRPGKAKWVWARGVTWFWATVVAHANAKWIGGVIGIVRAAMGL